MSKSFSVTDVASHKDPESGMFIIIDENVYDVTGISLSLYPTYPSLGQVPKPPSSLRSSATNMIERKRANCRIGFVDEHPGGAKILKRVAGKDASKQFWKYHNEGVLKKYSERLKVGTVEEKAKL